MNTHSTLRAAPSLLERAAEIYDFESGLRRGSSFKPSPEASFEPPQPAAPVEQPAEAQTPVVDRHQPEPAAQPPIIRHSPTGEEVHPVDRARLEQDGFVLPDAPVSGLAEEFRIVKRHLLIAAEGGAGIREDRRRTVLMSSAQPDDGKTFCAINLALSLAGEKDVEVLLVDGDFAKPEILQRLGLEPGPGLVDAILDPDADIEQYVMRTDIGGLSVLPAGRAVNNVPELLASERARQLIHDLTARNPRRIVIFDTPPVLMASPASILAARLGQVLLVVRADRTTEADLREAVSLMSGCDHVSLMLNGAGFAAGGRRFGSYYGYGQ